MPAYYNDEDLGRIKEIGDDAPLLWKRFQNWYSQVFAPGSLTSREKSLIALAVAHAIRCPYSIDAYSEDCLEKGFSMAQMTEAAHVGAAIGGGATLMHAIQMRNTDAKMNNP